MKISVLFIGESWHTHLVEAKGADTFTYDTFETAIEHIKPALTTDDIEFTHMPCHTIQTDFPESAKELREKYDVVIVSDCGTNTFLLPAKTFMKFEATPNKLEILKEFTAMGGGLCMVGGYLTFAGIDGKGRYHDTPVEDALPVDFMIFDDRVEIPQGLNIDAGTPTHEIAKGISGKLPMVFGYNRAVAKDEAEVVIEHNGDPILSVMEFGEGRSVAYASDCEPHWCTPEFCNSDVYKTLWQNIVKWLAKN